MKGFQLYVIFFVQQGIGDYFLFLFGKSGAGRESLIGYTPAGINYLRAIFFIQFFIQLVPRYSSNSFFIDDLLEASLKAFYLLYPWLTKWLV